MDVLIRSGQNDTPDARYSHLNTLIQDQLWYEEALRRELDADTSLVLFIDLARKRALGGRYYELEFLEQLPQPTETEIRQAFARYKQPVIARHLFYVNEAEANAAYTRLQTGKSFIDEAQICFQTVSFDSTAGWLGEIRYFQVDDAFAEAAFSLATGSFSAPVRSRQGWHIIKIEDRIATPIITESEFQNRKAGIASLMRIRKRRLEGDRFVRTFMENRDVRVDPQGLRALDAALARIERRVSGAPVTLENDYDTPAPPLTSSTPLASFIMNETVQTFTAEDYFFWFSELPFREARSRPAASIGRAVRNEAFALAGIDANLEGDAIVQRDVEYYTRTYLANSMRELDPDSTLIDALHRSASIRIDSLLFRPDNGPIADNSDIAFYATSLHGRVGTCRVGFFRNLTPPTARQLAHSPPPEAAP